MHMQWFQMLLIATFFLYPDLSNWAMADNYNLLRYGAITCYSGTAETGSAWVWTKYVQKQKGTDI